MTAKISESAVVATTDYLIHEIGLSRHSIFTEIQDDAGHLLIMIDLRMNAELKPNQLDWREISRKLDSIISKRNGEYSWMINFFNEGGIIDSYFGGDNESVDSGI